MDDIQEIKQSISIVEIAKLYGAEPKREDGNVIQCRLNPLRDEKTSSLVLYPSTNSWKDFGGDGGSIIDFIMLAETMTVAEAINKIKDMAGIMPKPKERDYAPQSFMAPNIVMKIWDQQPRITFDNGSKELLSIAPKFAYDEADKVDSDYFFDIVRLEKQTKSAFVLLRDTNGDARSLRYRRYMKTDKETGEEREAKWYVQPSTQSNFAYQRIKNDTDIVLIVEGTHDYLSAILCGYNVIALPSSTFKVDPELMKNKICVFIDDDDGKDFMRPLFESATCSKIWFDHSEFKKKNKIKKAKDFSDYLECFKSLSEFKAAMELQFDIITHASYTAPANRLLKFSDLTDDITPATWMVRNLLPSDGLLEIVGGSGSYKSFLILDMMFCISAGIEYHGHEVKQGACVYVAGEGKSGAILRVRALELHYGIKNDNFYILPFPSNLMDKNEMDLLASDIKAISPEPISMCIFDTLHRNSAGSDENSATDFSKMLGFIDTYLKPLAKINGYIHHTGNNQEAGARGRGTSSRFGAVDTSIVIKSAEMNTTVMTCEKQKDGEKFSPIGFALDKIKINLKDEYGEELYNLIPRISKDVNTDVSPKKKDDEKVDMTQLKEDIYQFISGNDGCLKQDIIDALKNQYSHGKINACLKEFKDSLWRYSKGAGNSFPLHAIKKPNTSPEVIEYKMDIAMGLF